MSIPIGIGEDTSLSKDPWIGSSALLYSVLSDNRITSVTLSCWKKGADCASFLFQKNDQVPLAQHFQPQSRCKEPPILFPQYQSQ